MKTRIEVLALTIALVLPAGPALARPQEICTATARLLFGACKAEREDDSLVGKAKCINFSDETQREQCLDAVKTEKEDKKQECKDQRELRLGASCLLTAETLPGSILVR